jgi:hypothetical protein
VNTVETVDKSISCEHRQRTVAMWVRNNPTEGPPVLLVEDREGAVVITLTNQTLYVKCPQCFKKLQELILPLSAGQRC